MLTHNPTINRRKATQPQLRLELGLGLGLGLVLAISQAASAWTLALQPDPITHQTRCLLSSATQITSDGYDTTPVTLVYNGTLLLAISESELDLSFNDLKLVIDENPPLRSDKTDHNMIVIFDQNVPELIEQFRKGHKTTVYLRFWPTWPVTQLFPVTFSLIGFSKALDGMNNNCQPQASVMRAGPG